MNGATCLDGINQYTCACVTGYVDAQCQTDFNGSCVVCYLFVLLGSD